MELVEAYIPIDRRLAMAQNQDLADRAQGAALFADISGFTPLTEAMAKELGPKRGAEEVTKQLDAVFSALIAELDRYRGSVIAFSGDAITCWFDGDNGLGAITCGLAMQEIMSQFATLCTPSGTTISLAIKVAITTGPVRRFRVGDPQVQYIDTLAGATLDHLAAAEHQANKGEILITAEIFDHLGDRVRIQEWRHAEGGEQRFAVIIGLEQPALAAPWPSIPSAAFTAEQIRPWLLPIIYERLTSGQDQFIAELRPTVALFVRFGGIDYDHDEAACDKLDAYIRWVQSIAMQHGGILAQLTIGDKGSYLYIAFGAPMAHDDDPARAVSTALALQSPPPEFGYIKGIQIGITRGRMRVGPYGGPTRRTYTIMGDAVNLAARLMSRAAPGEILVSQHIADAVADRFNLCLVGPISVKGKQEPILVSQVLDRRARTGQGATARFAYPLIGREAELTQVAQLLEHTVTGKGQILRLEGAAGVGKSHLAAAVMEHALARGLRVAQGTCQSVTDGAAYAGAAYAPWRQVFSVLLGLADESITGEDIATRKARQAAFVETFIGETNRDWLLRLPLLGDLLGLPIPDNATTAAFEPRLRQGALFDLVVEMLQYWAQAQPLLILVDDAHVMDEASRGLTVALGWAIAQMPALLTLVHRPPLSEMPILPELNSLSYHHRLDLNELSPADVEALIDNRLHGRPDALTLSLIQAETQGNPFFVEELVDALRESGNLYRHENRGWVLSESMFAALQQANCLTRNEGQWVVAQDAQLSAVDLGLPDSIQGVVLSRVDRLPESSKLTLKVASVMGPVFSLNVVAHVHPLRPDDETLTAQANLLEARDFTRLEIPQRRTYVFKHMVTHDVAYETLLFDQRRQLHKAVGDALELLVPDAIPQLAYHTFLGEDWPRALQYQTAAGLQSKRFFANQEGIEHLQNALRCAENMHPNETIAQRQHINAVLGELLTITSQYEHALACLTQARTLAVENGDCDAEAHTCRWLARLHELRGEFSLAFDWIRAGHAALGQRETSESAELSLLAGQILSRQGNYDDALKQCQHGMRIAEKLDDLQALARAYNLLGFITRLRGNSVTSIGYFQRTLDLYQQVGDIHGQALAHNQIANASFDIGQWQAADDHYRRAREVFDQTGDVYFRIFADNNLGGIALNQGRLDDALSFYREALHSLEKIGSSVYVMGVVHMNLGALFVRRGEIGAAREHLRAGQDMYAAVESRDFLSELHRHLAEAALVAMELPEAEEHGRQALDLARELNMRSEEGNALRILGEIDCMQGKLAQAEQYLAQSLAILEEVGHEYESARSRLSLSRAHLSQGKRAQGLAGLDYCIAVFQRLGAALDLDTATALRGSAQLKSSSQV